MRRLLLLAGILPVLATAQSTRIVGTTGQTAPVTSANGVTVDVTRVQGSNTTSTCNITTACATGLTCAGTSVCSVALLGKSTSGIQVTTTPTSAVVVCDVSINGTTWSEAATGSCQFDSGKNLIKGPSITTCAVGDVYQIVMTGGIGFVRARATSISGTLGVVMGATDSEDPSAIFSTPGGTNSTPPAFAAIAAQDGAASTTMNTVRSCQTNSNCANMPALLVHPSVARTSSPAFTAGYTGAPSMNVAGSLYTQIGDVAGSIATPTAKGTQGSVGLPVQSLRDSGRASATFTLSVASTATAETLVAINRSSAFAAPAACTSSSCPVTSGKTLVIQSIAASTRNTTGTTAGNVTLRIRANASGACLVSSPIQAAWTVALAASAIASAFPITQIDGGWELPYGAGLQFCVTITHPQWVTASVVETTDVTFIGYEY